MSHASPLCLCFCPFSAGNAPSPLASSMSAWEPRPPPAPLGRGGWGGEGMGGRGGGGVSPSPSSGAEFVMLSCIPGLWLQHSSHSIRNCCLLACVPIRLRLLRAGSALGRRCPGRRPELWFSSSWGSGSLYTLKNY